jgi:hypothetical protein
MTFPSPRKTTSQVPQVPNQVVKIQKRIKYHITGNELEEAETNKVESN